MQETTFFFQAETCTLMTVAPAGTPQVSQFSPVDDQPSSVSLVMFFLVEVTLIAFAES